MPDSCDPAVKGFAGWQATGDTGAHEWGDHLDVVRAAAVRGVRVRRVLRGQARDWSRSSGYPGLQVSTVPVAATRPNRPARAAAAWLPGRHGLGNQRGFPP